MEVLDFVKAQMEEIRDKTDETLMAHYKNGIDCIYCDENLVSTYLYFYIEDDKNGFRKKRYFLGGNEENGVYSVKLANE